MKLLYVTSEAYPFCKTGGLADVAGSLPPALAAEGVETAVILPLYDKIGPQWREKMTFRRYIYVDLGWRHEYCGLFSLYDRLIIGKYSSIACGAKFIFNAANHTLNSLSTYPFPIMFEEWDLGTACEDIAAAWDNHGDIMVGNDVWIGYEAVILAGVTIGDGAIIGSRAVVTKDVPPYTIVGGLPAKPIRRRYDEETVARLEKLRWWDWPEAQVRRAIPLLQAGDLDALEKLV